MNTKNPANLAILAALLLLAGGCATASKESQGPHPHTYNIAVDNNGNSDGNPQNSTQDMAVASGRPLYYKVDSPVNVTVYFYAVQGERQRVFLEEKQGRSFKSFVIPSTGTLEFVLIDTQPNSRGTVNFTVSDQPFERTEVTTNAH